MKRILIAALLPMMCLQMQADNVQTVVVNGAKVEQFATQLTFDGDQLTLLFDDGSQLTTDLEQMKITFSDDTSDNIEPTTVADSDERNTPVYDLRGQKVGEKQLPQQKGIYIIGKKKHLVH